MFAGHVGAGLAIGRVEPRVNVAVFVGAALLLDVLFWSFALLGWESVSIPQDYAVRRELAFVFPWTHGLVASLAWSAGAAWFAFVASHWLRSGRGRVAGLVAAAVFSHWVLDALVHRPELPVLGEHSPHVGLALWDHLWLSLAVETAIALGALWFFLAGRTLTRGRSIALASLVLIVVVMTVTGMTVAPPPPSALALAVSSLVTLVVVCACAAWIDLARGARVPS